MKIEALESELTSLKDSVRESKTDHKLNAEELKAKKRTLSIAVEKIIDLEKPFELLKSEKI